MGDLAIYVFDLADPSKVRTEFSDSPYDRWWLSFVKEVHGVDLTEIIAEEQVLPEHVYSWRAD